MRVSKIVALCLISLVAFAPALFAQESEEIKSVRRDIDAVRDAVKLIQNDLATIKQLLRQRPAAAQPQPAQQADISTDGAPSLGEEDAPVTIVEFSDYQCPFCARNFQQTFPQVVSNYVETGKVKYVFRDYPLESIHPDAFKAAEAARCAAEQDKFWEMHDKLFTNQRALKPDDLISHGKAVSLDEAKLKECLDSGRHAASVRKDLTEGSSAGVRGTPGFFIGRTKPAETSITSVKYISGAQPYANFKEAIDTLLAEAGN